jgi:NAD(P)-dependent dehydrogenase (short-subunit alcohol dehydrogenase family)
MDVKHLFQALDKNDCLLYTLVIIWRYADMDTSLAGKTYVVTGATSGIGLAAAEQLAQRGANILGVGRSAARCSECAAKLEAQYPNARVAYLVADLSLQAEVRALAQAVGEQLAAWGLKALDGLINNAGTFTSWQTLTPEGFETQWAVNYLASFLLSQALMPLLQAGPQGRIVVVSSGSHYHTKLRWDDVQLRRNYNGLRAYKQTKLADVLMVAEMGRRLGPNSTVRAFAADPGLVNTEIGLKGTNGLARWVWSLRRGGGISAEKAAQGIVFLATEPAIQVSQEVYWKHGRPQAPSPHALSEEAGRRLWEMSLQMTGMSLP